MIAGSLAIVASVSASQAFYNFAACDGSCSFNAAVAAAVCGDFYSEEFISANEVL